MSFFIAVSFIHLFGTSATGGLGKELHYLYYCTDLYTMFLLGKKRTLYGKFRNTILPLYNNLPVALLVDFNAQEVA